MAEAPVGDDVYGEDPTVNQLQSELARLAGFEAGLFMPSGTMTNQVAIALHTRRGEEVICAEGSHIYEWELGMMAAFSGVVPRFVPAPLGVPEPKDTVAADAAPASTREAAAAAASVFITWSSLTNN